jgi:hypothetical protein
MTMKHWKETMSLHDKLEIGVRAIELEKQGKTEEATRLLRTKPLSPTMAQFLKKYIGPEEVIKGGWNLSEAEANFGSNWLSQ